jgi:hypothetical protein
MWLKSEVRFWLPKGLRDAANGYCKVNAKSTECYLGFLFAMEDVAVYGYITPLKMRIVLALALSDSFIRDADIVTVRWIVPGQFAPKSLQKAPQIFKALHMAYYASISNPFLRLDAVSDPASDQSPLLLVGRTKWKGFVRRVDDISRLLGAASSTAVSNNNTWQRLSLSPWKSRLNTEKTVYNPWSQAGFTSRPPEIIGICSREHRDRDGG